MEKNNEQQDTVVFHRKLKNSAYKMGKDAEKEIGKLCKSLKIMWLNNDQKDEYVVDLAVLDRDGLIVGGIDVSRRFVEKNGKWKWPKGAFPFKSSVHVELRKGYYQKLDIPIFIVGLNPDFTDAYTTHVQTSLTNYVPIRLTKIDDGDSEYFLNVKTGHFSWGIESIQPTIIEVIKDFLKSEKAKRYSFEDFLRMMRHKKELFFKGLEGGPLKVEDEKLKCYSQALKTEIES